MKNKKGLSMIVSTLILILLVVVAIVVVWNVVRGIIDESVDETESCYNIFGKISINEKYTCYNVTNNSVQFSINMGDIEIDELLISIGGAGSSQSVQITNVASLIPDLANYLSNGFGTDSIVLPSKNGGSTYVYYKEDFFTSTPDFIKIAPIIGGNQCGISDSMNNIEVCS